MDHWLPKPVVVAVHRSHHTLEPNNDLSSVDLILKRDTLKFHGNRRELMVSIVMTQGTFQLSVKSIFVTSNPLL